MDNLNAMKTNANVAKYTALFAKHVPSVKNDDILIAYIANPTVIANLAALNPQANYVIYDHFQNAEYLLKFALGKIAWKYVDTETVDYLDLYNIKDMPKKFDCVIMNPPYYKNLHLKILAEAITHLKDDNSVCVNLSPVLWIEDPHAHIKQKSNFFKFKKSISDKCDKLEVIDARIANEQFGIGLYSNLGIYVCKNITNGIDSLNFWKRNFKKWEIKLFENIYAMTMHISDKCDNNKRDGIRVLIAFIAGNRGTLPIYKDIAYVTDGYNKNGIDWTKCKNNGGYEKKEGIPIPFSIKFNTENEAQNFYDSWNTTFSKWLSRRFLFDQHIQLQFLPWMEDYTQPWDDARFYKFFNITKEDQKIIEETMKPYK